MSRYHHVICKTNCLRCLLDPVRHFRSDINHSLEQVVHNLVASLAADILDLLQSLLGLLVGILLGLLVSTGVLQ